MLPLQTCEYCGLHFTHRDNLRHHIIQFHPKDEPFRLLYCCGRCFQISTRKDTIKRHVRTLQYDVMPCLNIHHVHEINVLEWDIDQYKQYYLPSEEDPLVAIAPFNPFDTQTQVWLSRNDKFYQPLYLDTQENLDHLDLRVAPSASEIDLDTSVHGSQPTFGRYRVL